MVEEPWHVRAAKSMGEIDHAGQQDTRARSKMHGGFWVTFQHNRNGNHTAEVLSQLRHRDLSPGTMEPRTQFRIEARVGMHGQVEFSSLTHAKPEDIMKVLKAVQRTSKALQKYAPRQ